MEMQDGMKGNPEESLRRALAEFAGETSSRTASYRVRQRLQREVQSRVYRRWGLATLAAALATAAALSVVYFGFATRPAARLVPSPPRTLARVEGNPGNLIAPAQAVAGDASVAAAASVPVSPKPTRDSRKPQPAGNWRKGEIALSPWYYNTALPPSARSVLVRSEVDAGTAMRFGVVSAGETTPVEILFGEDGLPRAMRFVHHLPTQSN